MKHTGITHVLAAAGVLLLAAAPGLAVNAPPTWRPPELVAGGLISSSHLSAERMMANDHYGNYAIAYADNDFDELIHYTKRLPGVGWGNTVVDTSVFMSRYPSVAFNRYEHPGISYTAIDWEVQMNVLKYANFDGMFWQNTIVEMTDVASFEYTSLAYDIYGNPGIAYHESVEYGMPVGITKFAYDSDSDGFFERIEYVTPPDPDAMEGQSALVFDAQNRPLITYVDMANEDLMFAVYDPQIGHWTTGLVDPNLGGLPSLALNPTTGQPAMAYADAAGDLTYIEWDGYNWSAPLALGAAAFGGCSLAFDPADGNPAIAFGAADQLFFIWHDGIAWQPPQLLDPAAGENPSLVINEYGDGWPAVSYIDDDTGELWFIQDPPAAPEPGTLAILLAGAAAVVRRRRKV